MFDVVYGGIIAFTTFSNFLYEVFQKSRQKYVRNQEFTHTLSVPFCRGVHAVRRRSFFNPSFVFSPGISGVLAVVWMLGFLGPQISIERKKNSHPLHIKHGIYHRGLLNIIPLQGTPRVKNK